ncbi:hypothetical protein Agub_g5309 [Astrephomene gubernaculifera]|uniref:SBP-type domain-containing protein n=1 Tax=Astrephomene gubernaculifera TaxID=47775 RepID=A0AAD3DM60_9CHLO|nr:hypothetical protein Agub_g5309 [Astrephomene gubernaculifera]
MQSAEDAAAAAAADTVATQNLLAASIASILQNTTAAVPPGPPPSASLGGQGGQGGGDSPTANRTNSSGGNNQAGAQGVGLSPGLIFLPAGLPFPLQLNGPGLQNLAPYLQLLPGLGAGLGAPGDANVPYGLPPLGLDGQAFNLAALLAGGGLDVDGQGADLSLLDPSRKPGGVGNKRAADGSVGAPYAKRERSEEGRAREGLRDARQSIPNLPHLKGKCHVESCSADLTGLSSYYQRYRTCELHLKAPYIMKDGVQQRFCQQCGRFHELHEFDGNKRSCRSRLQSHNIRRRKRTEEQLAIQAASESQVGQAGGTPLALPPPPLAPLGQMPLQPHGLLGGQPNLTELLSQAGLESLLSSLGGAAVQDPSKQPKQDDALAALLSSLSGLPQPDPTAGLLALTAGTDNLAPPLLDSLLKSAAASAIPGPGAGDLPGADALQQQLALALAGAPAAAAAIVGEQPGPSVLDPSALASHVAELHAAAGLHHPGAHVEHVKPEGPVMHVGPGEGRQPDGGQQMGPDGEVH